MSNPLDILSGRIERGQSNSNNEYKFDLPKHYRKLPKKLTYNTNADLDGEISRFLTNNNNYRINGIRYRITPKEQKILKRILKLNNNVSIAKKTTRRNLEKLLVSLAPTQYSRYIKNRVSKILKLKGIHIKEHISKHRYLTRNGELKGVNKITLKQLIDKNLNYINNAIGGNIYNFSVTDRHGNTYNVIRKRKHGRIDYYYQNGPKKGKRVQIFNGYKLAPKDSLLYGTPDRTSSFNRERYLKYEKRMKRKRKLDKMQPSHKIERFSGNMNILKKYLRLGKINRFSLKNIEGLSNYLNFKNKVINFTYELLKKGYRVSIPEGRRTLSYQRRLKERGASLTNRSAHLRGLAIDLYVMDSRGRIIDPPPKEIARIGAKYGLWNGAEMWEGTKMGTDYGHFQAYYQGSRRKLSRRLVLMRRHGTLPVGYHKTKGIRFARMKSRGTLPSIEQTNYFSRYQNYSYPNKNLDNKRNPLDILKA